MSRENVPLLVINAQVTFFLHEVTFPKEIALLIYTVCMEKGNSRCTLMQVFQIVN